MTTQKRQDGECTRCPEGQPFAARRREAGRRAKRGVPRDPSSSTSPSIRRLRIDRPAVGPLHWGRGGKLRRQGGDREQQAAGRGNEQQPRTGACAPEMMEGAIALGAVWEVAPQRHVQRGQADCSGEAEHLAGQQRKSTQHGSACRLYSAVRARMRVRACDADADAGSLPGWPRRR